MARIALIAHFYPPEPNAAANRLASMAQAFAAAGHAVRVYTGMPSFPDGIVAPIYRGLRSAREMDGEVEIVRVATYAAGTGSPGNRIFNWLSVALGITLRVISERERFDLIVVSSPPITLALPALAAAALHRAPLLVDVRDVWPEIAVSMGSWRADGRLARIVGRIAATLYRHARLITCVTETARTQIAARAPRGARIVLAPNGFDPVASDEQPAFAALPGVRDIVYVGNMGLATGLDVVLDAAVLLRERSDLRFVLVGGGADSDRLIARTARLGLTNVFFTGPLPRGAAQRALTDAVLTVVPLIATIVDSIPTKLFDAMLVGTPIVVSAAGEASALVARAGAGIAAEPGDGAALAAAIVQVADDPEAAARYGASGAAFVRENYDRAAVMRRLAEMVPALIAR